MSNAIKSTYYDIVSDSKTALVATTFEDDSRVKGYNIVYEDYLDIPTGVSYFLLDLTGVSERAVFSLPLKIKVPEGPIVLDVYEGGTVSANGIELNTFNPNRLADFVHQGKIYVGPTVTDDGTKLFGESFGSAGGFFAAATPGEGGASQPFINDVTKKWLLKIDNTSGAAITVNGFFSWFELPFGE